MPSGKYIRKQKIPTCHPDRKYYAVGLCLQCAKHKRGLKRYNLTIEEWDILLKKQNGVCAICKEPEKSRSRLLVDHDHYTQEVRGLLCNRCNWVLGFLGDSLKNIKRFEDYLKIKTLPYIYEYNNFTIISKHISNIKHRSEIDTSIQFKNFKLNIPIISSPMPDITEINMAKRLGEFGAMGIIHRFQSIEKQQEQFIDSSINGNIVGCAIGIKDDSFDRFNILYNAGCKIFCIDVANGLNSYIEEIILKLKTKNDVFIIAGNIGSIEGFLYLQDLGVDAIRCGIGNGSACTTKTETGIYCPAPRVITDIISYHSRFRKERRSLLIADGGIKNPSDFCKALAIGADFIMSGSIFAGTDETPGNTLKIDNKYFKLYRGAASFSVQQEYIGKSPLYNEGAELLVPYKGSVEKVIKRFKAGLQSSMSYMNSRTLTEFRNNVSIIEL
jgi:IMP dehydrogenase